MHSYSRKKVILANDTISPSGLGLRLQCVVCIYRKYLFQQFQQGMTMCMLQNLLKCLRSLSWSIIRMHSDKFNDSPH